MVASPFRNEKDFQQAVTDAARTMGWLCYHPYDSRKSSAGFPDCVLVRGSLCLFRELKMTKGKVSIYQQNWLDALTDAGQDAKVWYAHEWDAIIEELTPHGKLI